MDLTILAPFLTVGFLAIFALPVVLLLGAAKENYDPEKKWKKSAFTLVYTYLICLALFPFVVSPANLPFESAYISYVLVFLLCFVVYLLTYKKKE